MDPVLLLNCYVNAHMLANMCFYRRRHATQTAPASGKSKLNLNRHSGRKLSRLTPKRKQTRTYQCSFGMSFTKKRTKGGSPYTELYI